MTEYVFSLLLRGFIQQIRDAMGLEYRVHMKDLSEAYHDSYYENMVASDPINAVLDKLEQNLKEGENE